jgi:hypothetical protein
MDTTKINEYKHLRLHDTWFTTKKNIQKKICESGISLLMCQSQNPKYKSITMELSIFFNTYMSFTYRYHPFIGSLQ